MMKKKNDLKVNYIDYTKDLKFDVNNTFILKGANEEVFTYKNDVNNLNQTIFAKDLLQNQQDLKSFNDY